MSKSLRVLIAEDSPDDAALLVREVKRGGYDVFYERVETTEAMRAALDGQSWDVVLSDYAIPGFGGLAALKILQEKQLDLPFILISGTIGEEAAVQAMKAGVHDYFSKDKLARLVPAIERELSDAEQRRKRRQAEESLRQSEERYRLLFDKSPQPMWVISRETLAFLAVNQAAVRHYGYSSEEFLSMTAKDIRPTEDAAAVVKQIAASDNQKTSTVRTVHRKKDGALISVELTATGIEFDGKSARLAVLNDITERLRLEEERLRLERERAQILEQMPVGCIALDKDFRYTYWNPAAEAIFGFKQEEVIGKTPYEVTVSPEERAEVESAFRALAEGRTIGPDARQNLTKSGQTISCEWINSPVFDANGAFAGAIAMVQDITEREMMDQMLQRLLEQQITVNDLALALGESADLQGIYRTIYEKVRELMDAELFVVAFYDEEKQQIEAGYAIIQGTEADVSTFPLIPLEEAGHGNQSQVIYTGKPIYVPDLPAELKNTQTAFTIEGNGSITEGPPLEDDVERSLSALYVPMKISGKIIGVMQVQSYQLDAYTSENMALLAGLANVAAISIHNARLIEELQQAGERLEMAVEERTHELYQAKIHVETILNSSSDAIILTDSQALIEQTNPAFNALFAIQPDEMFGKPLSAAFEPEQANTLAAALERAKSGHTVKMEMVARRNDGSAFPADVALTWIYDESSDGANVVCSLHDTTVHKHTTMELQETLDKEKELSELKSRFVSMVSHDFRNPLATIQSSSDLIKEYGHRMTDERKTEHLLKIQVQVKRLVDMLNDILIISKAESVGLEFNPLPLNVESFCEEIIEEMRLMAETHQIVFNPSGNCQEALVDDKLLRRILTNLLGNAVKYSPGGSTVTLNLSCDEDHITFRVQDQGIGIPDEDQQRMFEVFHRASNVGSIYGSGLGLAIIKQATERHGGQVTFESKVDVGTTFIVTIPFVEV